MDPNANLQEQERILRDRRRVNHTGDTGETPYRPRRNALLREYRQALADWIARGGFAPDWSKAPLARKYYAQ